MPKPSIPRCLAEIVVPDTPQARVGLATDEDLRRLTSRIDLDCGLVTDVLCNWRLIARRQLDSDAVRLFIVGDGESRGRPVVTSRVVAIDPNAQLARTKSSSIYALREEWNWGDPPPEHVIAIFLALKV